MKLLIALIFVAGSATAGDRPVDFKGVPFGSSESVFKAKNKNFECGPLAKQSSQVGDRMCISEHAEFGGANATIKAFFSYDSLSFAVVYLGTRDFDRVVGALRIKFGEPTVTQENITTRLNLKLVNDKVQWRVGTVLIEGNRYSKDIETASVAYHDDNSIEEYVRRSNQQMKAGAKSL